MEDIFILGAGGLAREVLFLIEEINRVQPEFNFKGFVDKKKDTKSIMVGNRRLDVFDEDEIARSDRAAGKLAIGIGDPKVLLTLAKRFNGFNFVNLIHPNFVGHNESITFGYGNVIAAGCIFTVNIKVGSLNYFNLNATVGHDTVIGSCNVFNPGSNISGGVVIGDGNLVGVNASILQYVKMGSNSVLGASALLNKDLGDSIVAVGVPAKPLDKR